MAAEKAKKTGQAQKSELVKSLSQHRLSILLTTFLALLAVFLLLLRSTPEGQRLLISWQTERESSLAVQRFQELLSKDPHLGFALEEAGVNPAPKTSKPVLLVVLGNCEGCNEKIVREWVETLSKWETLRGEVFGVLVVQKGIEKVREVLKGTEEVRLFWDKDGKIARSLNAFFIPRAYGFVGGKLVWKQDEANIGIVGVLKGFLKSVKGEERAKEILNAWSAEMREKMWGKEIASFIQGVEKR